MIGAEKMHHATSCGPMLHYVTNGSVYWYLFAVHFRVVTMDAKFVPLDQMVRTNRSH